MTYMSHIEFKPIHEFFRVTISSIKYTKNTNSDLISLHVYNNSPHKITLSLGVLGYCETNATVSPTLKVAYRVNKVLRLLDKCQSTIANEELSINNVICDKNGTQKYLSLNQHFRYQNIRLNNKNSLQVSTFNTLNLHKKNLNN